ncbi:hypothetical protein Xcel_0823 [Xylanimonas cellulosilytica DSM 15894]|uniref:Uncharacterized protein n=1 Tax=Xylanimonas cellulosilytica (strain DSM 15894 / JCM 12276 / CECT 5975 / KCTC 9989 / LMG 20990 / NBRC 107835 / XIL07) TaxID=446471 RepID=D1BY15_XYLCX|nr:DUF6112 family protein [Xylanimonas cellulosilytica]ACZ29858.1 hypothetical protein Xcel_0823 [Xylanimonas cellulosilytica DSM 15894]
MIWTGPVSPDFAALEGTGLYTVVGALLTVALIAAVGVLVTSGILWAIAVHSANWHQAARARFGVLLGLGGAALAGGVMALANWLVAAGNSL